MISKPKHRENTFIIMKILLFVCSAHMFVYDTIKKISKKGHILKLLIRTFFKCLVGKFGIN